MRAPGTWHRLSLRARLLVIGAGGVAGALAIGSLALYAVLGVVGSRTIDAGSAATAADVATLVDQGRLPQPIPVTGSQIVQVVDARDRVVSASVNADQLTALLLPREIDAALEGEHVVVPGSRIGLDSPLRVTAVEAGPTGARRTVVVAQQFEDLERSQRVLALTLLATYPLLLLVLVLIAWRVIGASLRPVEALRAAADQISGTGQDTRLPVSPSRDEVHALAVTLNSMLDRLSGSRARQRDFVADAAHELRSPLASMQTQLEIAERLGEAPELTPDLLAEVRRMSALVEDLLMLARIDAVERPERLPEDPVDLVHLPELVRQVVTRYDGTRVPVRLGATAGGTVPGHHEELRRVLENLVDNAVRHARSLVEVSLEPGSSSLTVVVSDDGAGVPPADRDRVFERFTRLDDARDRDAGGSGLGLAIVRELVHHNGGTVELDASPAGGLAVRVRLPTSDRPHPG